MPFLLASMHSASSSRMNEKKDQGSGDLVLLAELVER